MAQGTATDLKRTVAINLANVKVADGVFLNHVIALFCDPHQQDKAQAVKSGLAFMAYGQGGKLQVVHRLEHLN